jgi:hypothetical protein
MISFPTRVALGRLAIAAVKWASTTSYIAAATAFPVISTAITSIATATATITALSPNGGRGGDLIDDIVPDTGRSGPTGNRSREMEPTRHGLHHFLHRCGDCVPGHFDGHHVDCDRYCYHHGGRRNDRERSRRSDVGSGGGRDEKGAGEPRETLRRATRCWTTHFRRSIRAITSVSTSHLFA